MELWWVTPTGWFWIDVITFLRSSEIKYIKFDAWELLK